MICRRFCCNKIIIKQSRLSLESAFFIFMEHPKKHFQVAVLGGGVTGSSIAYLLSRYTDLQSIALIEKNDELGQVNSRENNNSQTLHFGDIETNYSLEKAKKTNAASEMVVRFLDSLEKDEKQIFHRTHKMALAVGAAEVRRLEERFNEFSQLFPGLQLIDRQRIAEIEPKIVEGRPTAEPIKAFYSDSSYVVDFGGLAKTLAQKAHAEKLELHLGTEVKRISRNGGVFDIRTDNGSFTAEVVIVAMCAHSLLFAKSLGYGLNFSILPVGGNFYTSAQKLLNGKVYTMQSGKLPFAAVHGDPTLYNESETRFGPTTNIMPFLERNSLKTFGEFVLSSWNSPLAIFAFFKVALSPTLFVFLLKSLVYEVPYFGPLAFSKLAKKIIPTVKANDFRHGKTKAGIRPQLIDIEAGKLMMGETEIKGDKILFNITPSPGATSCLYNAKKSLDQVLGFLPDISFDEARFKKELL